MPIVDHLRAPLSFAPVYQTVVWGGRRMARWRSDLPDGPIGESWDISQQERGMSVVEHGPLAGRTLAELVAQAGRELVGPSWDGGDFPLLVKLIDAADKLSVQVHPDDALAQELGVGRRGKTECWFILGDGGELYQGTRPGVDRETFEQAIAEDTVAECLNRFDTRDGDFFFMPARTVHALGSGTLLYEIQQSCDVTFRVYDWGRVGLDGKPRPLHVRESLRTIDFADREWGPVGAAFEDHPEGGRVRRLASCPYFAVEERRAVRTAGGGEHCQIVIALGTGGKLATDAGELTMRPMRSYLVPAVAGGWRVTTEDGGELRFLVAEPR